MNGALNRLVPGGRKLERGVGRLSQAAGGLSGGLGRLGGGAERLSRGLDELEGGAGALRDGPLRRGQPRLPAADRPAPRRGPGQRARRAARGRRRTPARRLAAPLRIGLLRPLGARRRAARAAREAAGEAINLEGGGQAARILVVSTHPSTARARARSATRLDDEAARIGAAGGPASPASPAARRR